MNTNLSRMNPNLSRIGGVTMIMRIAISMMALLSVSVSAFTTTTSTRTTSSSSSLVVSRRRRQRSNSRCYSTTADKETATTTTTTKKKINNLDHGNNKVEKQRQRQQRSITAKETWSTIALEPTNNMKRTINLLQGLDSQNNENVDSDSEIKVYNQKLYNEFITSIKGTYYINGLSSCQIGDRLIHPFEAHGYCKSFVFNGKGQLDITC